VWRSVNSGSIWPDQATENVSAFVIVVPVGIAVPQLKFTVASVRVVFKVPNAAVS